MGTGEPLLPVDETACFTDARGRPSRGVEKAQRKLLGKVTPFLRPFFAEGEKVLRAVSACSPMTAVEQLTTGWIILYTKRCLLVVTDRRILHLPTGADFTPRQSVAEIRFGDIASAKVTTFLGRALKLTYRSGKKEQFVYVDAKACGALKALLAERVGKGEPSVAAGRHHLCPLCASPLEPRVHRCSRCFLEFKNRGQAIRYSILFPGGGYFYTGHTLLGILDAIGEGFLLVLALVMLVAVLAGGENATENVIVFLMVLGALVVEKLVTIFHSTRYLDEFIPVEKTPTDIRPR